MLYKIQTKQFIEPSDDAYLISIDPGTNNGLAIYSQQTQQYVFAKCFDLLDLLDFLSQLKNPYMIIIEDIIGNKPTFHKGGLFRAIAIGNKQLIAREIGIFDKRAQDVGGNKRDQHHILQWLEKQHITIHKYIPRKKSKTKLKHAAFVKETNIHNHLNEHTRDAIMLLQLHLSTLS
jgi:hypothetical protein